MYLYGSIPILRSKGTKNLYRLSLLFQRKGVMYDKLRRERNGYGRRKGKCVREIPMCVFTTIATKN